MLTAVIVPSSAVAPSQPRVFTNRLNAESYRQVVARGTLRLHTLNLTVCETTLGHALPLAVVWDWPGSDDVYLDTIGGE